MMTISGSMAACEQKFSCMNSQKNRPLYTTCRKNIKQYYALSINGPCVDEFDTSPHIMSWISNSYGMGKRHKEHKANQSKCKNEKEESIHKKKIKRK